MFSLLKENGRRLVISACTVLGFSVRPFSFNSFGGLAHLGIMDETIDFGSRARRRHQMNHANETSMIRSNDPGVFEIDSAVVIIAPEELCRDGEIHPLGKGSKPGTLPLVSCHL
jgi:hypothetical protein